MVKYKHKLEMKKIARFLLLFALLANGFVNAQDYDAECWDMFGRAKKNYLENGEAAAREQFNILISTCEGRVASEAKAWLQEQKYKQSNSSSYGNNSGIETITIKGVQFKMVRVKGGTFQMGATSEQGSDAYDDEYPVHSVTLSDYYIGQTEVTQELWEAVMGDNPSYFTGDNQCPVERVSWDDCQEFIKKLNRLTGKNFRLPTEAEWEYAARGGNKSKGYKYSGSNDADAVAWYNKNSGSKTQPVAQKQSNELGLYDMSGNVWEWCQDWYGDYTSRSQSNPKGANTGSDRVLRGGSWFDYARYVQVSYRHNCTPDTRFSGYGLRLAL